MSKIDTTNINIAALLEVINYLEHSERQSYEEYLLNEFEHLLGQDYKNRGLFSTNEFYDNSGVNHIYASVRRLQNSILVNS